MHHVACRALLLIGGAMVTLGALAQPPACEPRSHSEPGRLNLATSVERYGMSPCRAVIEAYIPRNTPLRALEGALAVMKESTGTELASRTLALELAMTDYGMRAGEVGLGPVEAHGCHDLTVSLEIARCLGEDGVTIPCPEVRARESEGLAAFEVAGSDLMVCRG